MSASLIACCDFSPVFELGKDVFDDVSFFVSCCVVGDLDFTIFTARDDGCDVFFGEGLS